jgi:tetratricopeptide (TPR) repeat protein
VNLKAEYNLGLSYEGENRVDDAIACYQKAIAMEKVASNRDEQPYLDLGALLSRSNSAGEAIPYLQHAAEIKPDSGKAQYELAKAFLSAGNTEQARVAGERAIHLAPDESSYHYLLGRVYAKAGKQDLAAAQFQETDALLKKKGAPDKPHVSEPRP